MVWSAVHVPGHSIAGNYCHHSSTSVGSPEAIWYNPAFCRSVQWLRMPRAICRDPGREEWQRMPSENWILRYPPLKKKAKGHSGIIIFNKYNKLSCYNIHVLWFSSSSMSAGKRILLIIQVWFRLFSVTPESEHRHVKRICIIMQFVSSILLQRSTIPFQCQATKDLRQCSGEVSWRNKKVNKGWIYYKRPSWLSNAIFEALWCHNLFVSQFWQVNYSANWTNKTWYQSSKHLKQGLRTVIPSPC